MGLIETGVVTLVIDKIYPLSETSDDIRYLEEGCVKYKVTIAVRENQ